MAIQTVVRDEELTAGCGRILVAFVRISDQHRFYLGRKSRGEVTVVLHESEAVAGNHEMTYRGLLSGRGRRRSGRIAPRLGAATAGNGDAKHSQTHDSLARGRRASHNSHRENTNSSPPQLVHLLMS